MATVGICTTGTAPHLRKRQAVTCPAGLVGCSVCSQHLHSRCSVPPYSQRLWCRCAVPPTLGICRTGVPQHAQWVSAVQVNCSSYSWCLQLRCPSTARVCSRSCATAPTVAVGRAVTPWCLPEAPAGQVLQSSFGRLWARLQEKEMTKQSLFSPSSPLQSQTP